MPYEDKQGNKGLMDKSGNFLFDEPKGTNNGKDTSKHLDKSTNILNKSDYDAMLYYRILGSAYGCDIASEIADTMERLNIATVHSADDWNGRKEAVEIGTSQAQPKKETILRGIADNLDKGEE